MSSFKKIMESYVTEFAGNAIRPFVKYAIENPELFSEDPDEDKLVAKITSELKLPEESTAKSARSSTKSSGKVSDAVKGLGASKAGSKSGKKSSKKEDIWFEKSDFLKLLEDNPDEDYCSYVPPRGQHKEKFCGKIADHTNSSDTKHKYDFRCDVCKDKVGRGKKVLEEGDGAPSRSLKKKPVGGITKRNGSRPGDKKKKKGESSEEEDSEEEDGEKMEVIGNDSLTELLGKDYYLFNIDKVGMTLVYTKDDENNVVYGKFKGEVDDRTKITAATIASLQKINSSKIDKAFITANDLEFMDPSELEFNKDSSPKKSKKNNEESSEEDKKPAAKGKTKKDSSSEEEEKKPAKGKAKKEESSQEEKKPAKGKAKKEESSQEEKKPAKGKKDTKKKEESSQEEKKPAKGKKGTKKNKESSTEEPKVVTKKDKKKEESTEDKKKSKTKPPVKKPVKKPESSEEEKTTSTSKKESTESPVVSSKTKKSKEPEVVTEVASENNVVPEVVSVHTQEEETTA